MLKSIKVSFKDTIIYGLGNIAVKIVGLILIPLYTNPTYFSFDDFGVLGVLEITGLVLTAFLASALPQSLTRWYWDKDHRQNQKGIFFMAIASQIVISIAFCLVLIPLSGLLSQLIFENANWTLVLKYVILSSAIQAVNNIVNTLMRLQSKSLLYTITNLLKLTVVLSLTLYFILRMNMGLDGIYLAQVVGNSLVVLILSGYTIRNVTVYFSRQVFFDMNRYGFPLLLANISAALLTVIDRYSLNYMTVLKSVALYTMAFKITSVLKLVVVDSMKLAIGPMMIKRMDSEDNKRFYSKVLLYSSYVLMFAIIGASMFAYEAIKVMAASKNFWDAVAIVPILAISIFFVNMKDITVYGLHIAKKTRIIGLIVVFSSIVSLGLNILLIPLWDIKGAALATLVSQLVYWAVCYYYSQKVFYVPYEMLKVLKMFIIGSALAFSSLLLNGMDLLPRLILKTIGLLSFPFILYILGFYEKAEIQAIKGFFTKWSKLKDLSRNIRSLGGINDDM